jgi:hypothetical protein
VIQQRWFVALLALGACSGSGGSSGSVAPAKTPAGVVESFMQAVADSNLSRMAELWGSTGGPAAKTKQPADYERRIVVMQAYLRNETHKVLPPTTPESEGRQDLQVEIRRQLCTTVVPFTVIKSGESWLVNQVDLTKAGNPARPCVPGGEQDTTAAPE